VLFQYAPFFLVGYVIFRHRPLFEQFKRVPLVDVLLMLALVLLNEPDVGGLAGKILGILAFYQCGFVLTGLCVQLFTRFFDRESRLTRLVSDSAYTIYLLHQFLVVLFATWLAHRMPANDAPLKYALVVSAVLLVTIGVHQFLIARIPSLGFLFNGRDLRRRPGSALRPDRAAA
jgi:peptidoglycan/LPS O-acetylase OafA/YrhL